MAQLKVHPPMTTFQFSDRPAEHYQVQVRTDAVYVAGQPTVVRKGLRGAFVAPLGGRSERLRAVAHGDTVFVQLRGRVWKLNRVDPTRAAAVGAASGAGAAHAPMPGVVVSVLVTKGQAVQQGDALMVIESMKLQMTISADMKGVVVDLPLALGQTFQRNDMLVRVAPAEEGGAA